MNEFKAGNTTVGHILILEMNTFERNITGQIVIGRKVNLCKNTLAKTLEYKTEQQVLVLQRNTFARCIFVIVIGYAQRQATDGHEEELGLQLTKRKVDL